MAARVLQLANKAKASLTPAYSAARTEIVKQYDTLMTKNAEYVVKDPEQASKLLKQYTFTQLSRCVLRVLRPSTRQWARPGGRGLAGAQVGDSWALQAWA